MAHDAAEMLHQDKGDAGGRAEAAVGESGGGVGGVGDVLHFGGLERWHCEVFCSGG